VTIEIWLAFVAASLLMLIVPGPTVLTVIGYALKRGRKSIVPLSIAVSLGHATTLTLSIAGLGALLTTSPALFDSLKLGGGLYLIYLIGKVALSVSEQTAIVPSTSTSDSCVGSMFRTWLVTTANPQTIVFFVAFLPQFIDTTQPPLGQMWILCGTFVVLAAVNSAIFAICAQSTAGLIKLQRNGTFSV